MNDDSISVVVPTWNSSAYVEATLATVAAQRVPPRELVVSDDGSSDSTCNVVTAFAAAHPGLPTRLLRNSHLGPGAARNVGVWSAAGEWIAFLDSDDLWHPEKIAKVYEAIRADQAANLFCHNELIRSPDGSCQVSNYGAGIAGNRPFTSQLFRRNLFSTSAVTCRRMLVMECGGFDPHLTSAQDYDLWLKMSPRLAPRFLPDVLGTYILRPGNISSSCYWLRLANLLRVKQRHRRKVAAGTYAYVLARTVISHFALPVRAVINRHG